MPPRRKAAGPPQVLAGCAIALSGKFDSVGLTQTDMDNLIRSMGGSITRSVTKVTTHVVCSELEFDSSTTKPSKGAVNGIPVLKPQWVTESESKATKLDTKDFEWSATPADDADAPDADEAKTSPPAVVPSRTRKRTGAADVKADDNSQPPPKKAKAKDPQNRGPANGKADSDDKATADDKEEKTVAEGQFIKKKDVTIPLDEFCPLTTSKVYVDADTGLIYDASLNQTNAVQNNNKFYRVQVVFEPQSKVYKTWTRWGRVGEAGQNALLGNGTVQDAVKNFEKKFKDKSGLPWDRRGDDPKPGKYAFVERSYNPDSDDEDDADEESDAEDGKMKEEEGEDYKPPECTLEKPVKELMELIFNQQYFQATMTALNYDANKMPLGKLSKTTISRGFQQLKDLAAVMNDPTLGPSKWNMPAHEAIVQLSNTYYSVIPHDFGRTRPPIIQDQTLLKKEVDLLESLSDMKAAADIMKVDRKAASSVHELDRRFNALGLEEITTLDAKSREFETLSAYLQNSRGSTHNANYEVQEIFRIERQGEKARFDASPFASVSSDRRLLWHGSRCTNYGGILSQGLRIAPPEAPSTGYMFGKGAYIADVSSKSAAYCASYLSNGHALLLLCEAELGDPMLKLTNASYNAGADAKAQGMLSTWGQGRMGPSKWIDASVVNQDLKGTKMPDPDVPLGDTGVAQASLFYNEYICYDVAQIRLRYLFHVKM